jgi:hypothetical protein
LCERYLAHHDDRERIADAARTHFDRYLERTNWAAYYLHTAVRLLDWARVGTVSLLEGGNFDAIG